MKAKHLPRSVKATGLVVGAVLLGLVTVQGTYALWSSAAEATPGTVGGADFTINLSGSPSGQSTAMTLSDGSPAQLALTRSTTSGEPLTPAAPAYASVTASNATNAGGAFYVTLTAGQPTIANGAGSALAQYLSVSAVATTSAANCPAQTGYQVLGPAGLTTPAIAKGASMVICFKLQLNLSTPSTVAGQTADVSVPLVANQVCGVPNGCA